MNKALKYILCVLAVLMLVLPAGCGAPGGQGDGLTTVPSGPDPVTLPPVSPKDPFALPMTCIGPDGAALDLTEEEQDTILAILNRGLWREDIPECEHSFALTIGGRQVRYAMHCGIFMDLSTWRTYYLSDEDTRAVNQILYPSLSLRHYDWSGRGFSTKVIEGDSFVRRLTRELDALSPSGEEAQALSDGIFDPEATDIPAAPGTLWLQTGKHLYRVDPGFGAISRVESHYGAGEVLEVPEGLRETIRDAWQYHPRDYYTGTWQNGAVTLNHVYQGDSDVTIRVLEVDTTQEPNYHITLELTARQDRNVKLWLHSFLSEDNLGSSDYRELAMTAGVPQTVELYYAIFGGSPHWLTVTADNTVVELKVS